MTLKKTVSFEIEGSQLYGEDEMMPPMRRSRKPSMTPLQTVCKLIGHLGGGAADQWHELFRDHLLSPFIECLLTDPDGSVMKIMETAVSLTPMLRNESRMTRFINALTWLRDVFKVVRERVPLRKKLIEECLEKNISRLITHTMKHDGRLVHITLVKLVCALIPVALLTMDQYVIVIDDIWNPTTSEMSDENFIDRFHLWSDVAEHLFWVMKVCALPKEMCHYFIVLAKAAKKLNRSMEINGYLIAEIARFQKRIIRLIDDWERENEDYVTSGNHRCKSLSFDATDLDEPSTDDSDLARTCTASVYCNMDICVSTTTTTTTVTRVTSAHQTLMRTKSLKSSSLPPAYPQMTHSSALDDPMQSTSSYDMDTVHDNRNDYYDHNDSRRPQTSLNGLWQNLDLDIRMALEELDIVEDQEMPQPAQGRKIRSLMSVREQWSSIASYSFLSSDDRERVLSHVKAFQCDVAYIS